MKKHLLFILVAILSLSACHPDEEVTLKDVVSIASPADITVPYGTDFSAITFPEHVTVTYADNSTTDAAVNFDPGSYNSAAPGTYTVTGTITLVNGTSNTQNLKAAMNVTVRALRLKSTTLNGVLSFEYFYDDQGRLASFKQYNSGNVTEYIYSYNSNNKVTQRLRRASGSDYPEKYFYHNDGTLDRIEFYYGNNILSQTHTYTYTNGKISRYDNSDQSINGLKYRTFVYDNSGNVSKVSFDFGNSWQYTYATDKKIFAPLISDPADPLNQTGIPVATFTYVQYSNYTSDYTYNSAGYPTQEVRTYLNRTPAEQETYTYLYE